MKGALILVCFTAVALPAERTLLWRDPGPIRTLDLAGGPGGGRNAPSPPFTFVEEEKSGTSLKVVVTDARRTKWMVKFGEEAKAETFASRIAWAAGYPVRASYYVRSGQINGYGPFRGGRFQMFDHPGFHEIAGSQFNLLDHRGDRVELNGLKLTLLLVANWDAKSANTAIFSIAGRRYSVITDWGASMGDPASTDVAARKWNCAGFNNRTSALIDNFDNGYILFNYRQYAGRFEQAISEGIRISDMKWFMARMGKLSDSQLRAGLLASGATAAEASCFTAAMRNRLNVFAAAARGELPVVIRTRTVTRRTRAH